MFIRKIKNPLSKALSGLPKDFGLLLKLRYGLDETGKKLPLKELAGRFNTTTDRMITMEAKALRKFRSPLLLKPIMQHLKELDHETWNIISESITDSDSIVRREKTIPQISRLLPGEILLLIDCFYNGLNTWLSHKAVETDQGWFHTDHREEEIVKAIRTVEEMDWEVFSPVQIPLFLEKLHASPDKLAIILALSPVKIEICRRYVVRRPLSTPAMRAIRIQLLLRYKNEGKHDSLTGIVKEYNSAYNDDVITCELAESILKSKTHLFHSNDGEIWSPVNTPNENAIFPGVDHSTVLSDQDENCPPHIFHRSWSETNGRDLIVEILESTPVYRIKDITKEFLRKSDNRFGPEVVAVILALDHTFLEVAPRKFALRENFQDFDPIKATTDYLLTWKDCQNYILQRFAGEPLNAYPFWTPAMEHKWALWLEKKCEQISPADYAEGGEQAFAIAKDKMQKLFESLLSLADLNAWPMPDTDKEIWRFKKESLGRYRFLSGYGNDFLSHVPSLQELFTVSQAVEESGFINYLRANRVQARIRAESSAAAITLMLLVALEIVLPGTHWQKKHAPGPGINAFTSIMLPEIKKKGFLHWDDPAGLLIREQLHEKDFNNNLGWVKRNELESVLKKINGETDRALSQNKNKPKRTPGRPGKIDENMGKLRGARQLPLF